MKPISYYRLLAVAAAACAAVFVVVRIFAAVAPTFEKDKPSASNLAPRISLPLNADTARNPSLSAGISRSLPLREGAQVVTTLRNQKTNLKNESGDSPQSLGFQSQASIISTAIKPSISAETAIVEKFDGTVLWNKDGLKRWPAASLTKLMTAAVAATQLPMDLVIRIEDRKLGLSVRGDSRRTLMEGEMYSVRDLIAYALLPSNNEAADALAGAVGREKFVSLMNQQAANWGMVNTHYEEPTGLSVLNQSSPSDIAILLFRLKENFPKLMDLSAEGRAQVREQTSGRTTDLISIHKFAATNGFLGGKTGFTYDAKGNLASLFLLRGAPVAVVVMGSDDREGDTTALLSYLRETR